VREAQGDQGGTAAANARASPRTSGMAQAGGRRLLPIPRSADQCSSTRGLPLPCRRPLAAYAPATRPETPHDMGSDRAARRPLAPQAANPPPLAKPTLRRQTPKVGAVCGKPARTVLCGGRSVMRVPTAIRNSVIPAGSPRTDFSRLVLGQLHRPERGHGARCARQDPRHPHDVHVQPDQRIYRPLRAGEVVGRAVMKF
jgi:hypothetical protein